MTETTGNRCGHDPANFRHCDVVKRGRGGQAPLLGVISAYVGQAAHSKERMKAWHRLNKTGRGRRSEIREAMAAVIQFLFAKEYQLDTRRCAKREKGYFKAPDADLIARQISQSKEWEGRPPLSVARVRAVLADFQKVGYIELSHQQRRQKATGEWQSAPKVIQFTKLFFLELGGRKLWSRVARTAKERADQVFEGFRRANEATAKAAMKAHYTLSRIFSPRQRPPGVLTAL